MTKSSWQEKAARIFALNLVNIWKFGWIWRAHLELKNLISFQHWSHRKIGEALLNINCALFLAVEIDIHTRIVSRSRACLVRASTRLYLGILWWLGKCLSNSVHNWILTFLFPWFNMSRSIWDSLIWLNLDEVRWPECIRIATYWFSIQNDLLAAKSSITYDHTVLSPSRTPVNKASYIYYLHIPLLEVPVNYFLWTFSYAVSSTCILRIIHQIARI